MAKPLAEETVDIDLLAGDKLLPQAEITAPAGPEKPETLVRHACLVAEYTSYMAAAGYSTTPGATAERNLGAWSFLSRFPQPETWLELPAAEQMRLPPRERNFVHYLFLRHVLPLPPAYALMAGPHLGDMARRLLERDTYQRYREAALRLGYAEGTIRRQFQSLLCLMAWAQKPLAGLTRGDVATFILALRAAHRESEDRGDICVVCQDGLPRSWSHQLGGLRRVLSHLGVLPEPAARRRGKHSGQKLARPTPAQQSRALREDSSSPQSRLVAEYTTHMAAAGYSTTPSAMTQRSLGAWSFLSRFPHPEVWLDLPLQRQVRLRPAERHFLHYLFLRHLLPMPPGYILAAGGRLGDMARRLLERDTYQRYQEAALGLGYDEPTIRRQFEALLCLMAWAQKPMVALRDVDLDTFADALRAACRDLEARGGVLSPQDISLGERLPRCRLRATRDGLPVYWRWRLDIIRRLLHQLGILSHPQPARQGQSFPGRWQGIPEAISATVQRYLGQMAVTLRPTSLPKEEAKLRRFFSWLAQAAPDVTRINHIQRHHIEDFKEHLRWAPLHPRFHCPPGATLKPSTIAHTLYSLSNFFSRIAQWGWPEAPARPLLFAGDFPRPEQPLPRFLEEPEAARFLQVARTHPDPFTRVCGVALLRTGLRKGELLGLTRDCIVRIGDSHWLRVPLGKLHKERFVPLHSEVKQLLEEWASQHLKGSPPGPHDPLFTHHGRLIGANRVSLAVQRIAEAAGITARVSPHRLRHTLATMAINHGMSLEGIAALLGHRSLSMTLVYARLSNRTLQKQYSAVSGQMEQLCGSPSWAPPGSKEAPSPTSLTEGHQTPHSSPKAHWMMLGNGYCTRPQDVPCEYESICESCPGFQTTADFLPHLRQQMQDAESKGQSQRARLIAKLIHRLEALP